MNSETSHGDFCGYVISRSANCSRDIRKSVSLNGSETITPSGIRVVGKGSWKEREVGKF